MSFKIFSFSQKTGLDILCEVDDLHEMSGPCFQGKKKEKKKKSLYCHLLVFHDKYTKS